MQSRISLTVCSECGEGTVWCCQGSNVDLDLHRRPGRIGHALLGTRGDRRRGNRRGWYRSVIAQASVDASRQCYQAARLGRVQSRGQTSSTGNCTAQPAREE